MRTFTYKSGRLSSPSEKTRLRASQQRQRAITTHKLGDYEIEPVGQDDKKTELLEKAQELIDKANALKTQAEQL